MSSRRLFVIVAALAVLAGPALAATLEVSQPVQLTSNAYYERGQSVVYDGSSYWVFFGRSASVTDPYATGDPDVHDYVCYAGGPYGQCLTNLEDAGIVDGPNNANGYLGETGAAYFDGDVWCFMAVDVGATAELYGWYNDGSWNEVGPFITGLSDGQAHHDEVVFDGELWILEGSGNFTTMHSATPKTPASFSTPLVVPGGLTGGLGHFFVDGSSLFLALGSGGTYYIYAYDDIGVAWVLVDSKTITGYYDPTLYKVGSDYVFHCAPCLVPWDRQWIVGWVSDTLDASFFDGPEFDVIEARYGSNVWVAMWPIGFTDAGGTSYLFYTSERDDPTAEGAGNIWCVEVDWDVTNDHYTYVQEAIDSAVGGDTIDVAAGTYAEYLHITTDDLTIEGAGIDASIIDLDGLMPYWHYSGCSGSYASRGGVVLSGYGSPDEIVENVVFRGFTVKNAGLNPPGGGAYPEYVDPDADGQDNVRGIAIHNGKSIVIDQCKVQNSGYFGISAGKARCTSLTQSELVSITDCICIDNLNTGISIGDYIGPITVTGNTCTNNKMPWTWSDPNREYAGKGIEITGKTASNPPTGLISGNTCTANGYQGIVLKSYSDGMVVEYNNVSGHNLDDDGAGIFFYGKSSTPAYCVNDTIRSNTLSGNIRGIVGYYAQDALIADNSIDTDSGAFDPGQEAIKLDGCNGCLVTDNTLTDCDGTGIKAQNTWDSVECYDNMVSGNTVTNANGPGIRASSGSHDNTFEDNTVDGATFAGIFVYLGAYDNTFTDNLLTGVTTETFYTGEDYEVTQGDGIFLWGYNGDFDARAGAGNVFHGNGVYGNAGDGIENQVSTMTVDASANWWGTYDAAAVATLTGADVDYTPWLGGGTPASPGFTGDYSSLYVDDDSEQTGSMEIIEEGIDLVTGSTVNVAAGTYEERLNVNKSLDLRGAQYGVDPTAAGARTTPAAESTIDITGIGVVNPNVAVEIPSGVTNVSFSGFTVIGSPTSHAADESNIRCWDDNVTISDNILEGWLGVLCKGAGDLTVDRNRMVVNKNGVVIQPNPGMDVTLSNNHVSLGSSPGGDESGLYITGCTNVEITGNTCTGFVNAKGVVGSNVTNTTISGNTFTGNKDAVSFWGTTTFITISDNVLANSLRYGISIKGQDIDITGNQITGSGDVGVNIDKNVLDTERVTVNYNNLSGSTNYGLFVDTADVTETVDAEMNWWGSATGPTHAGNPGGTGDAASDGMDYDPWIGKTGGENIVCDPDPLVLYIDDPDGTIDVNYLGGGGGLMYGYSLKFTWDSAVATTTLDQVTEGGVLSDAGSTRFFKYSSGTDEITVDCVLLGATDGVTAPGTMFRIEFDAVASGVTPVNVTVIKVRDKNNAPLSGFFEEDGEVRVDIDAPVITDVAIENLTLAHTDAYIKDTDAAKVTATVTDVGPGTFDASNIEADLDGFTGGTDINPNPYAGNVATWTLTITSVTCSPQDGTVTVYVDATDSFGNPAVQGSATITSDNIAPTAIVNFAAAPAHNEAELTWDNPALTDDNFYQVEIQSNAWSDYPTYVVGMTPSYPADENAGTDVWEGTGGSHTAVYLPDGSERDIYYYQAFASDMVLHFGPADAGARDRCTNYWLGDVSTSSGWGYDGLVGDFDIDKLAGTYAVSGPSSPWDQCDVGPTDDFSRVGIPEPDALVSFEDLMIFAMNYGVVAPKVIPFFAEQEIWPALELALVERSVGTEIEVALTLRGNAEEVKGLSAVVGFDPSELEFVSARLSDDMSSPLGQVFFWSGSDETTIQVDAAVLGTGVTIGGSGDVAILTFRPLGDGYELGIENAVLRGADNEALDAEYEGIESKPDLPAVFRLAENVPNPFNPVTKVRYHVPHESEVTIRIYDVAGREVLTLLDRVVEPGRHEAVWDGRDAHGEAVGSGVYFCVMEAAGFHDSRKMTLLK